MTVQLVTRVPDDVAAAIDDLVREGVFASRSDVVRAALTTVIDGRRRPTVGQAITEGYRRAPRTGDEVSCPDAVSAAIVAEEPW